MRKRKAIAISVSVALLLALGLAAWIGYRAGGCPPPDNSVRDSLAVQLYRVRGDSARLASESLALEKERNDALARIKTVKKLLAKQMGLSHSLGADSIMLGLLADPPSDLDTLSRP